MHFGCHQHYSPIKILKQHFNDIHNCICIELYDFFFQILPHGRMQIGQLHPVIYDGNSGKVQINKIQTNKQPGRESEKKCEFEQYKIAAAVAAPTKNGMRWKIIFLLKIIWLMHIFA